MNRQRAKELLPIIQAFAEGKIIESRFIKGSKLFSDNRNPSFSDDFEYRIKSEPTYRPFKDKEEAWNEMQKHQPFGWVKDTPSNTLYSITRVTDNTCIFSDGFRLLFNDGYKYLTFIDGTPFGIKN